jgi:hypothetical protein
MPNGEAITKQRNTNGKDTIRTLVFVGAWAFMCLCVWNSHGSSIKNCYKLLNFVRNSHMAAHYSKKGIELGKLWLQFMNIGMSSAKNTY